MAGYDLHGGTDGRVRALWVGDHGLHAAGGDGQAGKKMMLNIMFLPMPCAGNSTAAAALAISCCRRLHEIPATGDSERSVYFSGFLTVLS